MTPRDPKRSKPEPDDGSTIVPARSAPLRFSRRSLLMAGVGLAATACTGGNGEKPTPEQVEEVKRQLGSIAQKVREGRTAIGRVTQGPTKSGDALLQAMPSYFPQPSDMRMEAEGAEKTFTLNVDYLQIDIPKRDGEIFPGTVRAFNNHVPGPTMRCKAGDRLNITMNNNLPMEDFTYDYMGCTTVDGDLNAAEAGLPHGFNSTNLHTHGLHVSPQSLCGNEVCPSPPSNEKPTLASDDVFVTLPPGTSQEYCIVLPDFHAPGTHWYHAHKHGSTSLQVNNGLAGALIVEEQGEDRILGSEPHEDLVFIMQEILEKEGENEQLVYTDVRDDPSKFLVNGVYQPWQKMQTGEIQRWRFINATSRPRGLAKLRLVKLPETQALIDASDLELPEEHGMGLEQEEPSLETTHPEFHDRVVNFQALAEGNAQPLHVIAVDGISFYGKKPKVVTEWDFAPGNRVDFLVQVNEPGKYAIAKDVHPYSGGRSTSKDPQILAYVEVSVGSRNMVMPTVIPGNPPCYLDPIYEVYAEKNVDFQAQGANNWSTACSNPAPWTCTGNELICDGEPRPCQPQKKEGEEDDPPQILPRIFAIDCERFDADEVEPKYTLEINSVEEWTLRNFSGGAHPFHIHVNPFQVVEIFDPKANNGAGETRTFSPEEATWQDVVAIPLANGATPGHVKIRHRFLNYVGDFVIHCHFLNHEDLGMMKRVQVVPTASAPGTGPCKPLAVCSKG